MLSTLDTNPVSLEARLAASQNALNEAKQWLAPIETEFGQIESSLKDVLAELKTENESLVARNLQIKQIQTQIEAANLQIDVKSKEYADLEAELQEKEAQIPVLATAEESASKAAALIPGDEALKQSADTIKIKHAECVARIVVLEEAVEKSANAIKAGQEGGEQLQSKIDTLQNVLGPINKRIEELRAQEKPLTGKRDALLPKLESARKLMADCEADLARWNNEVAFDKLMAEKSILLTDANKRVVDRETGLAKAKVNLEQAQLEYDSQAKRRAAAEAAVNQVEMEILKLRSKK